MSAGTALCVSLNCELYYSCQQLVITSLIHCGRKFNTCSVDSNAYLFYVSLAGFGLGLGLCVGLVTAGLDYITVSRSAHLTGSSFSETNSSKSVTTANVSRTTH